MIYLSNRLFKDLGKPLLSLFPEQTVFSVEGIEWKVFEKGNLVNLKSGEQFQLPNLGWEPT